MMDIGKELQAAFDDGYAARDKEIVRCGECKYDGHCVHQIHVMQKDRNTFFCADGKRKDGEHDV